MNVEAFERTLLNAWNLTRGAKFHRVGKDRFLIQFGHEVEKKRIYWRSPWSFDKNLVILRKIPPGTEPSEVNLDKCDFHVQITGLPNSLRNHKVAEFIGNAIGDYVEYDEEDNKDS